MKAIKSFAFYIAITAVCLFFCIGYATISGAVFVNGSVQASPALPDVYIKNVSPYDSAGVMVNNTVGTVMSSSVSGQGSATFTVTVVNISDKTYIFERVIDGAELGIEGVYAGTAISYELINLSALDEIAPNGGTLTFDVKITVPRGVTADAYVLKFNFIEKSGTEILPGFDEHTVTFKYNNGQPDSNVKVHANEAVPHPETPTRTNYTFHGWYKDSACTEPWNFEIDRVKESMTLYAGWEYTGPTEFRVTFNPKNGTASHTVVVKVDSLVSPPETPVLDGYSFIGWYTDESCTKPWNFDTDKVRAHMTLFGGWEIYVPPVPPEHYITFKPGNGDPDNTVMVLTGEFIPRPATPIRNGYVFIGWYIDESCTTAWNFEVNRVDSDLTLYGGWDIEHSIESIKYSITFKPNNGNPDSAVEVEFGALIPRPPLPTREGYTFTGWYTDAECTVGWNFDIDKPGSDMTLYAGWEKSSGTSEEAHGDFLGLVEALLSNSSNCLNNSDVIFDAVMESLTSKKRPEEDAPILHCSVNSISGGTMSSVASFANAKLTENLHFIFEVDPDPAYQNSRMRLYMYYGDDIEKANIGDTIMVYQQIVTRGSDGVWRADGTYIGVAAVGNYFGGGNSGKDVKTISPYTWKSAVTADE